VNLKIGPIVLKANYFLKIYYFRYLLRAPKFWPKRIWR